MKNVLRKEVKNVLLSMDWDYVSMYPEIHGEWKQAYEEAMEWGLTFLEEKKLKITFFCCPENATMFPDYIKNIKKAGHQVGLHIHTIDKNTSFKDKEKIMTDGKDILEDLSQQKIEWFRAGMFYLDKEIATILTDLEFKGDSSLVPDINMEKWVPGMLSAGSEDGKSYETKYFEFEGPMDYRGFPEKPYYLLPSLLEVPPSRYCFDFHVPQKMLKNIEEDVNNLSVLYIHPKNLGGLLLKESMEGKMKNGFTTVVNKLIEENSAFLGYDDFWGIEEFPKRFDLFERLYPFDRN